MFEAVVLDRIETHISCSLTLFSKFLWCNGLMRKNILSVIMNGNMPGERWSGLACEYYVNSIIGGFISLFYLFFNFFLERERLNISLIRMQ
jgi:hypothetical protein